MMFDGAATNPRRDGTTPVHSQIKDRIVQLVTKRAAIAAAL